MPSHVLVVFTNPVEGQEQEFNDWYDNVHLPDLLTVTGIVSGQRFEAPSTPEGAPGAYLTVYELEADPEAVSAEMTERVMSGEFKMSPAIDLSKFAMWGFKARGPRRSVG
jgi:hypothetical protein